MTSERSDKNPRPNTEELQEMDKAGDGLGLSSHKARKTTAERLLACGTCSETLSASKAACVRRVYFKTWESVLHLT